MRWPRSCVVLGVYLLGRDLFDANTGLLAAALGLLAPMFILLSGAFVSHLVTMALLTFFTWGFVRARADRIAPTRSVLPRSPESRSVWLSSRARGPLSPSACRLPCKR